MAVTKRTRYEVLKRDNHTCRYCGIAVPEVVLTVDHVTPVALGGSDDPGNLVAACRDCNAGKASTNPDAPLVADVQQDALRWTAAMKLAAERLSVRREAMLTYCLRFEDELHQYGWPKDDWMIRLPDGWQDTIENFYKLGLPIGELTRALAVAMTRRKIGRYDKFRYMCGVCWSVLTELQSEARDVIDTEDA